MIHRIPESFLIWVKKDLKKQIRNGYRVFYEGVRIYKNDKKRANYSEKELEVLKCRELFENIKEEAMKSMNLTAQFSGDEGDIDGIEYPDNAINIDISYVEYIRRLTKLLVDQNIDCKKMLIVFNGIPHEKIIYGITNVTESLLKGESTIKELNVRAVTLDYFRVADEVDVIYRNEVAAKKIDTISKKKKIDKIYVHYGESHIDGIASILTSEYGWKLTKTIEIDSQNPVLR